MTEQQKKIYCVKRLMVDITPEIRTLIEGQRFKNAMRTGDDKADEQNGV